MSLVSCCGVGAPWLAGAVPPDGLAMLGRLGNSEDFHSVNVEAAVDSPLVEQDYQHRKTNQIFLLNGGMRGFGRDFARGNQNYCFCHLTGTNLSRRMCDPRVSHIICARVEKLFTTKKIAPYS